MSAPTQVDVLVVGAGPTGLALAAQLQSFGTSFQIVDRAPDQVHESRTLAVQPRTLETLAGFGLAERLIERGNPAVSLHLHAGDRVTALSLFDIGVDDTAFPFLLFASQAETEAVLNTHLADRGVLVERGVEFTGLVDRGDDVRCELRHLDDRRETVTAEYVVGCDGARSQVRASAGIGFPGSAYPQTFVLADLPATGLDQGLVHAFLGPAGMALFFPLDHPAPWRLLAPLPRRVAPVAGSPTRDDLQSLADGCTAGVVRVGDPVWSTYFRIHRRHAATYRSGRVFVAGDAAHVHSPAGAQGMNTGIQDAANLGWKLALVTGGWARPELLTTYEDERRPVGTTVLRFTDRAFRIATSTSPLVGFVRGRLAPRLLGAAGRAGRGRGAVMRRVAQLAVDYRHSPLSHDDAPRTRRGPRAGDRLPDAPVHLDERPTTLHNALRPDRLHVLLVGPTESWPTTQPAALSHRVRGLAEVHHLDRRPGPGVIHDHDGIAHRRLGLPRPGATAVYLLRPDGHIAYRSQGSDLSGLHDHLDSWFHATQRTAG